MNSTRSRVPSPALLRFLRAQSIAQSPRSTAQPSCFPINHQLPTAPSKHFHSSRSRPRHLLGLPAAELGLSHHSGLHSIASSYGRVSEHPPSARSALRRAFSTTRPGSFWNLFRKQKPKSCSPLQPNDLPPLTSFLDDAAGLGRILKPTNELKLRCTEFDENGSVTLVNGEFKKSELIAKYGLLPRDLRKIDSSLLPHILVRPSAILLNLLHLRVLIKHNRVLVFDAYGSTDSYTQSVFMYDLEGKLSQKESRQAGSLPYEFRALEAVLISVTGGLEGEYEGVREPVVRVLRELEEDIDRDKLRYLLIYSKKLGTFEQKARLVRDAIDDLLEADDDLAAMYLTEKAAGKKRSEQEHTEVEMLLESYHKVCDEIVQASENLVSNIRNTEEIVKAILDSNRNSLMLLDLKFSIGTLGLGAGTFVAALYGMNLTNFLEESNVGFAAISAVCVLFTAAVCVAAMKRLSRVQRVSMWGESGRRGGPLAFAGPGSITGLDAPLLGGPNGKSAAGAAAAPERRAERARGLRTANFGQGIASAHASHVAKKKRAAMQQAAMGAGGREEDPIVEPDPAGKKR